MLWLKRKKPLKCSFWAKDVLDWPDHESGSFGQGEMATVIKNISEKTK